MRVFAYGLGGEGGIGAVSFADRSCGKGHTALCGAHLALALLRLGHGRVYAGWLLFGG